MEASRDDLRAQPLPDLVERLSHDVTLLARQEVALAKREAADKLAKVQAEALGLAIGGGMVHAGLLATVAALVLGLAEVIAPWLAGLIVGVLLLGCGGIILLRGKARLAQIDLAPKLVLDNVAQDIAAVKEAAR
jgi:hypothetical protein